jgi:hypothetical protein
LVLSFQPVSPLSALLAPETIRAAAARILALKIAVDAGVIALL